MKQLSKKALDDLIILLRFQKQTCIDVKYGCLPYQTISKIVKKSYDYCRNVCCRYLNIIPKGCCNSKYTNLECDDSQLRAKAKATELELRHIKYLTNQETLKNMTGYTLEQRCSAFVKQFPDKKLAPKKLQSVYKKNKIKRKKLRRTKVLTDKQGRKIRFLVPQIINDLQVYKDRGFRIIYLDEMCVTKSTIPTHEYSNLNTPINIDLNQYQHSTIAALAGVSQQMGVDHVMLFDKSVDTRKFKVYLDELRSKYFFDDICLFMDNLSVHTCKAVRERLNELGIAYVFNAPYSPNFNGIEFVFSLVKSKVKNVRLRSIILNQEINLKKEVIKAFDQLDYFKISRCIQHSFKCLTQYQ